VTGVLHIRATDVLFSFATWQHITSLREMTSWPPSWNHDVISEIRPDNRSGFIWWTILPNYIPVRFWTTPPTI